MGTTERETTGNCAKLSSFVTVLASCLYVPFISKTAAGEPLAERPLCLPQVRFPFSPREAEGITPS